MAADLILCAAMLVAAVGAVTGNRTAWVLLASVILCKTLDHAGIYPGMWFWLLVDGAVIAAITHYRTRRRDVMVLLLFVPVWALYFAPDPLRYDGITLIVAAQLALTFPALRFWHRTKKAAHRGEHPFDDFELMVKQ